MLLKTAKGLLDARISALRIRRMLESLRRQLPDGRQLWNVTIYADGRRIVVWDGTAHWQPDSGQFLFNFAPREIVAAAPRALRPPSRPRAGRTADEWVALALELEDRSPEEARRAYGEALTIDPRHLTARLNLGCLYHRTGDVEEAEACYRSTLAKDPNEPVAHFNLAVLLEERDCIEEAIRHYRAALDSDPRFTDVHHNLALLYERQGKKADAIRHLRELRALGRSKASRHRPQPRSPDDPS
jgi:Tfp pilus assembly protein PilF